MSDYTIMVIWVIKILLYSSPVYSCHLFLISSASVRSIPFLFFIMPIFAWKCSLQFSRSVMSGSLQPHELQQASPPCPSPTPGVYPNACPSNQWCHPTISSSVVPFSSCLQSFPASGSFQMSQLFTSGGEVIGASASTSVLPMNTQDWSPLGWTGWISLQSKGLSRVFSNTTVQKHQFFCAQLSLYSPTLSSLCIFNFLEDISSLSHSIVFLFALITEEGFLISPSKELCIYMGISFLFSFAFCFSSFSAICKSSSDNHFLFAFLFLADGFDHCLLYNVMNLCP